MPGDFLNPYTLGLHNAVGIIGLIFRQQYLVSRKDTEDIAVLIYTSGTTGAPKGVPLTLNLSATAHRRLCMEQKLSDKVVDQKLVTSRKTDDIPAFNRKMIEAFAASERQLKAMEQKEG